MERWTSRIGFILAAVGAAVGLGNIWRFPAVVGQNGGGAYLLPYLIAAFALAVPLLIFELSIGRSLRADVVTACRRVSRRLEWVGWLVGAAVLAVLSYYLVIAGWVLAFLAASLVGYDISFGGLTDTVWPIVLFLAIALVVGVIVSLGVVDGIERMARTVVPLAFVIIAGLALYSITMDGFLEGLEYFFTPDAGALVDPVVWSAAFGQVFFSFSVGMGIMLTYGSYLEADVKLSRSAVTIAIADLAVAIFAGIFIFTVVFTHGIEPTIGTELAFESLPTGFEAMGLGWLVAPAFFALLFVAALAPSVSMLEVGVAASMERFELDRLRATIAVLGVVLVAGLPSAMSYSSVGLDIGGRPVLDAVDGTVGTFALPIGAVLLVLVFAWIQDRVVFRQQLPSRPIRYLVSVAVPVVLVSVTVYRVVGERIAEAWHRLPGAEQFVGPLGAGVVVAILATIGLIAVAWRAHRRS